MNTEEKKNKAWIENVINDSVDPSTVKLEYDIKGCHVEVKCDDIKTLECIENILKNTDIPIRGSLRVTYNNFIKK